MKRAKEGLLATSSSLAIPISFLLAVVKPE
jgi:hypothetical protein